MGWTVTVRIIQCSTQITTVAPMWVPLIIVITFVSTKLINVVTCTRVKRAINFQSPLVFRMQDPFSVLQNNYQVFQNSTTTIIYITTAGKRRLCFYTCLSVILFTRGGACLGLDPGGGWGVWLGGSRPRLRGEVGGLAGGGVQAHTQGGGPGAGAGRWCIPACTEADTTPLPQQVATAAGSTHPTGMHSCS